MGMGRTTDANDVTARDDALLHELLAPLERVRPVVRGPRRRANRGSRLIVVAAAAAVIAMVAAAGLWQRSGASLTDQALAAIGTGPYLRVVIEEPVPYAAVVNLETGEERAVVRRLEAAYDELSGRMSFKTFVDGEAAGVVSGSPDPALRRFVTGFRDALEDGSARVVGRTEIFGRSVDVLSISSTDDPRVEEVALDADNHKPVAMRFAPGDGWARVVAIESSGRMPAEPAPNAADATVVRGSSEALGSVKPADASRALGTEALWVGRSTGGLVLSGMHLERLTTTMLPGGETRTGLGLILRYGSSDDWIDVSESASWHVAHGFYGPETGGEGLLPAEGSIRLSCDACGGDHAPGYKPVWTGQLRTRGLYVRLRSPSRERVIDAAAALTPVS